MSLSPYHSYILNQIRAKIKEVYAYGCQHVGNLNEITSWPRSIPLYEEFINDIVYVGLKSPDNSIRTLYFIAKDLQNPNLKNIFVIGQEEIKIKLYELLIYYIFADSVVQLMMHSQLPDLKFNHDLYTICSDILFIPFPPRNNNPSKNIFLLRQCLIRQLSVIVYKVQQASSKAPEVDENQCSFNYLKGNVINNLTIPDFAKNIPTKEDKDNLLLLYRYLEPPAAPKGNENPLDYIKEILPLKNQFNDKTFKECIKSMILQLPRYDYGDFENDKAFSSILKSNIDYRALFKSRDSKTTMNDIKKFCHDNSGFFKDDEVLLRSFLYFLRDPKCKPMDELWEYGNISDNYFLIEEKDGHSNFDETQENNFMDLFFQYIAPKIGNNELSTKIIFNLLSRNVTENIPRFNSYLKENKKNFNPNIKGPFFNALTIIFDERSGFYNDGNETINIIRNSLKELIIAEYKANLPNITKDLSYCKTISSQSCPESLLTSQDVLPQISEDGFMNRISEAEKLTSCFNLRTEDSPNSLPQIKRNNEFPIECKIKTYLITILFHIINASDSNIENFVPLVIMALSECRSLSYFSLYALQVFYIRKEFTRFPILDAISKVMETETIGNKSAFTLLNLLNQLLAFHSIPVHMDVGDERNWFNNWSNKIQAILLAHLTSPYVQVRDMTLIVMKQLSNVLTELNVQTTVVSLLRKYDSIMMQRIAQRLRITGISNQSFENLSFSTICRSSQLLLYTYALVEYAQILLRCDNDEVKGMNGVLRSFYQLEGIKVLRNQWKTIKLKDKNYWEVLPIISFTQRVCPMYATSKEYINQNFNYYKASHSLIDYEIYKNELTAENEDEDMINDLKGLSTKQKIEELCKNLESDRRSFDILAAIANSLSIELFPDFVINFTRFLKEFKGKPQYVAKLRLNKIICILVLSTDFTLFISTHMDKAQILYTEFLNWYHKYIDNIEKSSGKSIDYAREDQYYEFLNDYCSCVSSLSQSLLLSNNNGALGAVRTVKRPPWFKDDAIFNIGIRRTCFNYLFKPSEIPSKAILSLIEPFKIFEENYPIDENIYRYFLILEAKNSSAHAFHSLINNHPKLLFDQFLNKSLHLPIQEGYYLFRALCEHFTYNNRDINVDNLEKEDYEFNKEVVQYSGKLILSALIFIGTPHEECRKNAFALLKRVLPIMCAFQNKDDIRISGNINTYLSQHQGELSGYSLEPTKEQVFDLASYIAENMPFVVPKVFEAFFGFFNQYEKDSSDSTNRNTNISVAHDPLLFNVISPFARYLRFETGSPVYPDDFHDKTNKKGIDFVNNLINIYPLIRKADIPFYVNLFGGICYRQENIQGLANILIMNSGANLKDRNILDATTSILLYLIQNSDPAVFLSLLVQRLSFGYWFTDRFGSTALLTTKPYHLLNWMDLTLNILREVALANFSLLFPYIHTVLHYCLIFNNYDERNNSSVSSLLQIIVNNVDSSLLLPENCKISFQSKTASDLVPISGFIECLKKPLKQLLSTSIKAWKDEALQWQTSCGDLILSERSAIIYSLLDDEPGDNDNDIIMHSLNAVIQEYTENFGNHHGKENLLFGYLHGVLEMLYSNVEYAFANNKKAPFFDILQICLILIGSKHNSRNQNFDEVTSRSALKLIKIIVDHLPDQFTNIVGLARLMAASFNESNIVRILTTKILHDARRETSILGLLLLYFYATISAYQSISPYSTFITNDLINTLIKKKDCCGYLLGQARSTYAHIFESYFNRDGNLESIKTVSPLAFISQFTAEIWTNNIEAIQDIIAYYKEILNTTYLNPLTLQNDNATETLGISSNVVRDTIFSVIQAFVQTCPEDRRKDISIFNEIVNKAIHENSQAAKDFLLSEVAIALPDNENSHLMITPDIPAAETSDMNLGFITESLLRATKPLNQKSDVIDFNKNTSDKVLMILTEFEKHENDHLDSIVGTKFQPFEQQNAYWNQIMNEQFKPEAHGLSDDITALEFFTHAKAKNKSKKTTDEIYAAQQFFDPDCFILKDDEFGDYEKRLENPHENENDNN